MERFRENEQLLKDTKATKTKELAQGKDMREQSLETFTETQKRKMRDEESPTSTKRRNTGTETFRFLKEKTDSDKELEINFGREKLMEKSRIEVMKNETERDRIALQQQQMKNETTTYFSYVTAQQEQNRQALEHQNQIMAVVLKVFKKKDS